MYEKIPTDPETEGRTRPRITWSIVFWAATVVVYLLAGVLCVRNLQYTHHLEAVARTQVLIIEGQAVIIDSLEALLHIQEVDMAGLRTLCYIKTPAG